MTIDTAPFRPIGAGSQPPNDAPEYGSTRLRHP
jgi:protocatechuate 3,4-dioxygenase beta subunit